MYIYMDKFLNWNFDAERDGWRQGVRPDLTKGKKIISELIPLKETDD
jgi:hypothetical protein